MSAPIDRPAFFERQVLGAADLAAVVTYEQINDAVHERSEHIWGVAQGLDLEVVTSASGGPASVVLRAGVAVDVSGRRVVVPTDQLIAVEVFIQSGVVSSGDIGGSLYPVFVVGIDQPKANAGGAQSGGCATSTSGAATQATRITEGFQITFGRPGDERPFPAIAASEADPPGGASGDSAVRNVLVGFVQIDAASQFAKTSTSSPNGGVQYVGVRANDVIGYGSTALRTQASGARFALVVEENGKGGAEIRFAKMQDDKEIAVPFRVSDTGDVSVTGSFHSPTGIGDVPKIEAGSITNGMRVPLPAGITEDMVTNGSVTVHVRLTPRAFQPDSVSSYLAAQELSVDADRRVTARYASVSAVAATPGATSTKFDQAYPCDYLVIVVPTPKVSS